MVVWEVCLVGCLVAMVVLLLVVLVLMVLLWVGVESGHVHVGVWGCVGWWFFGEVSYLDSMLIGVRMGKLAISRLHIVDSLAVLTHRLRGF